MVSNSGNLGAPFLETPDAQRLLIKQLIPHPLETPASNPLRLMLSAPCLPYVRSTTTGPFRKHHPTANFRTVARHLRAPDYRFTVTRGT